MWFLFSNISPRLSNTSKTSDSLFLLFKQISMPALYCSRIKDCSANLAVVNWIPAEPTSPQTPVQIVLSQSKTITLYGRRRNASILLANIKANA